MEQILVVDDDAAVRSAFKFALEDTPCQLVVASDGEDGLAKFKAGSFALVITDLKMLNMNGMELIDAIRKLDSQVPLRIITAFAEEFLTEIEQSVQAGGNFELIRKPLERNDIRDIVASLLEMDFDPPRPDDDAALLSARYHLRLYITGETTHSNLALVNAKRICEEELKHQYTLEVINIFKNPQLAAADQIIATPTLIKKLPAPIQRIIGDLSNKEKVLMGLDLKKVI